jgi:hypothetical protein
MIIALSLVCLLASTGLIAMGHSGQIAYALMSAAIAGIVTTAMYRQHCKRYLQQRRG